MKYLVPVHADRMRPLYELEATEAEMVTGGCAETLQPNDRRVMWSGRVNRPKLLVGNLVKVEIPEDDQGALRI
jgi:hypothetical protein